MKWKNKGKKWKKKDIFTNLIDKKLQSLQMIQKMYLEFCHKKMSSDIERMLHVSKEEQIPY